MVTHNNGWSFEAIFIGLVLNSFNLYHDVHQEAREATNQVMDKQAGTLILFKKEDIEGYKSYYSDEE